MSKSCVTTWPPLRYSRSSRVSSGDTIRREEPDAGAESLQQRNEAVIFRDGGVKRRPIGVVQVAPLLLQFGRAAERISRMFDDNGLEPSYFGLRAVEHVGHLCPRPFLMIVFAARKPGAQVMPPPGWDPLPHK